MSKSTEQLIVILKKECEVYEEYMKIADEKTKLIIDKKINLLDKMTIREEKIISEVRKIDTVRNLIIGNLLKERNVHKIDKLEDIIHMVEMKYSKVLLELKNRLEKVLMEIKRLNDLNEKLINQSLDYIEFNVNLYSSLKSTQVVYKENNNDGHYLNSFFDGKG
ncbi:flagellar protein FlgN [Anaeromicrobium sediminis]|uniref:Flagellar biosynthesis protein FlgN n=1 Tax=Anaeromicrobium sediminis TaxID=1478221 RepID=A0A267MKR4_9FIRM|nr:flagellar protein FlgN [Anaeromicrobium sediminis]PAB59370.1 hypothetical protein CCE28_10955 [Anaeromicrobium sediminis]